VPSLLTSVPLLLVGLTATVLAVLVARALRDDEVLESVRLDVRRLGEAQEAVRRSHAAHLGAAERTDDPRRLRG